MCRDVTMPNTLQLSQLLFSIGMASRCTSRPAGFPVKARHVALMPPALLTRFTGLPIRMPWRLQAAPQSVAKSNVPYQTGGRSRIFPT